jgi:pimeloyl-ACP methyl ester carboxylesterase
MSTAVARNGDLEIAYQTFGEPGGEPMLLMNGLEYQMVWWPADLCAALVEQGFHLACFDYRDCGLSTHLTGVDPGSHRVPAYTLAEMIGDGIAVLDALGWPRAHLLGMSMGAALAQVVAVLHPDRVASLTLVGGLPIGGNPVRALPHLRLGSFTKILRRRYGADRASQTRRMVDTMRATSSKEYPLDEEWAARTAEISYDRRAPDKTALTRQIAAGVAFREPVRKFRAITAPTLVIHGDRDPLIRASAGRAIVRRIPGSRLLRYPGMGHGLARPLWPSALREIAAHAARASALHGGGISGTREPGTAGFPAA